MRRILIGLAMLGLAGCSISQQRKETDQCDRVAAATIDQRIAACSRLLETPHTASVKSLIYYDRGIAYGVQGAFDPAIADFTEVIALKPDFAMAYYSRGLGYAHKGLYDQAIADFTKAIAQSRRLQALSRAWCVILRKQGSA